ncbi:hypothetical protein ACFLXE_00160 [Chloroflexota bacterium]
MGYAFDHDWRGIDAQWDSSGTALTAQQGVTVYDSGASQSGVLSYIVVQADSPKVGVHVELDTVECLELMGKRSMEEVMDMYGRCGPHGFINLVFYDEINDKYMMVIDFNKYGGGVFAERCKIELKNTDGDYGHNAAIQWYLWED